MKLPASGTHVENFVADRNVGFHSRFRVEENDEGPEAVGTAAVVAGGVVAAVVVEREFAVDERVALAGDIAVAV